MQRPRWLPPGTARLTAPGRVRLAELLDWGLFALAVALFAQTVERGSRTTGPTILLALVPLAWWAGLIDARRAARRAALLALALLGGYLIRYGAQRPLPTRGGLVLLWSFLALAAADHLPRAALGWLRRLGRRLADRPAGWAAHAVALVGVAAPAGLLYATAARTVWCGDTIPVVPTAVQEVEAGSRDLTRFTPPHAQFGRWTWFGPDHAPYWVRRGADGSGWYSSYPAGMELFAVPVVAVAKLGGADLNDDAVHLRLEHLTAATVSGLALGLVFLCGLHLGTPRAAYAVCVLLGTGSTFFTCLGVSLWQHDGVVFWMLVVMLAELRTAGRWSWAGVLAQGIGCALMFLSRPSAATFLVPFGLWVLARDWRRGLAVPAVAAIAYAPWALLYYRTYGSPFGPSMVLLNDSWSLADGLVGVLASPARGLFVYQPWMLLLALLLIPAFRAGGRPAPRGFWWFAAAFAAVHLLLVSSWPCWWGGHCYGSRLAAELVPLAGLAIVRPVDRLLDRGWGRAVLVALAVLAFALHAPLAYFDAWGWNGLLTDQRTDPPKVMDWRRPPFLHGITS